MKRNPQRFQKGKQNNNLILSIVHQNGTVHVNQSQQGNGPTAEDLIRYIVDHRTLESYSAGEIKRGTRHCLMYTAATIILMVVAGAADLTSLYRVGPINFNYILYPTILAGIYKIIHTINYTALNGTLRRGGEETLIVTGDVA